MTPRPDYSPAMLRMFLHARAVLASALATGKADKATATRKAKAGPRHLARVTQEEFDLAWTGRLLAPEPRVRLWAVLGHFPGDHGIALTHGGQEAAHG